VLLLRFFWGGGGGDLSFKYQNIGRIDIFEVDFTNFGSSPSKLHAAKYQMLWRNPEQNLDLREIWEGLYKSERMDVRAAVVLPVGRKVYWCDGLLRNLAFSSIG